MTISSQNPFIGPRTFEEQDRQFFFGRDREARELLSLVIAQPLTIFYAQSGTGKSSLINTLLIPQLRHEGFHILPKGRVGMQPIQHELETSNIFIFNLLFSLDQNKTPLPDLVQFSLTNYLQRHKFELFMSEYYDENDYYETPETIEAEHQREMVANDTVYFDKEADYEEVEQPIRALIIDQFEEIFTHYPERWQEREGFFQQLQQAMADDPYLWVIISLREDFIASLDPYTSLFPNKMRARFRLEPLQREAALQAVEKPTAKMGIPFAPNVAEQLVDNLRRIQSSTNSAELILGAYVEPVHLQLVCHQLWAKLPPDCQRIETQHVQQFGDVDQVLINFYETTLEEVTEHALVSERSLRTWVNSHLITPGRTRGLVYRGKEETMGLPNEAIDILHQAYIIRAEIRGLNVWYELAHDRLVDPILQSNHDWEERTRRPLAVAANIWAAFDRDPSKLYRGELLREAKLLAKTRPHELSDLEKEFVIASLEAARVASTQRIRYVLVGALVIILALIGLVTFAMSQTISAEASRDRAATAGVQANLQRATAEAASTEANSQRVTAVAAQQIAESKANQLATSQAEAILQKATAEAASTQAIKQQETAKAERQEAVQARETLARSLEVILTAQARPTAIATQTPTPPLLSPTPPPFPLPATAPAMNHQATATVMALQQALDEIRATQTVAAIRVSMVYIPAGEFQMGFIPGTETIANINMPAAGDEQPARMVYLPAYWIDQTEVSNGDYHECIKARQCTPPIGGDPVYHTDPRYHNHPVNFITWYDAQAYCEWRGKRLPTEAEWEKAARGTDGRVWPWGNYLKDDVTRPVTERANVRDGTQKGLFMVSGYNNGASPYGVLNMTGNVWEWVNDWYNPTYYVQRPNPDNAPPGPSEAESNGMKVFRGGSFLDLGQEARVDERNSLTPDSRAIEIGFRCAKSF